MRSFWNTVISATASVVLTAGIVAYADPALADVPTGGAQVKVAFDRGAIMTVAGHAALERRIRMAASTVCESGATGDHIAEATCRETAVIHAEAALADQLAQQPAAAMQVATR